MILEIGIYLLLAFITIFSAIISLLPFFFHKFHAYLLPRKRWYIFGAGLSTLSASGITHFINMLLYSFGWAYMTIWDFDNLESSILETTLWKIVWRNINPFYPCNSHEQKVCDWVMTFSIWEKGPYLWFVFPILSSMVVLFFLWIQFHKFTQQEKITSFH